MKTTKRDGVLRGKYAALVRLLILGAAGISGYLLLMSLSGGRVVGCAPGSGCDAVLQSRWAYLFGVPVSGIAVLVYTTLLFASYSCGPASSPRQRRGAWEIIMPCAVLTLGAALWFVALQAMILRRFCPWCMAAHLCGATAAILFLMRLPIRAEGERKALVVGLTVPQAAKLGGAALLAVALLAIGQAVAPQKTFSVASINIPSPENTTAQTDPGSVARSESMETRELDLFGGMFRLNLNEVPVWGSPDATHKLVSLFDYTCHHCEVMHGRLLEVHRHFSNELAIISLPMPLDAQCNPTVRRTPPAHTNACLYAKLGLAVWRARPEVLLPYDDWFFETFARTRFPPPLPEAFKHAADLVGDLARFDAALKDPWVDRQLQTSIRIYETNYRQFRSGSMPQFILGTNLLSGTLTTSQLTEVITRHVAGHPPQAR